MIDEDKLKRLLGAVLQDGDLWAIEPGEPLVKVTGPGASDDFRNLRNASLLMYATLTNAELWIERLSVWLELVGGDNAIDSVLKMQAAIRVSRRCAIEGLENIASDKKDS